MTFFPRRIYGTKLMHTKDPENTALISVRESYCIVYKGVNGGKYVFCVLQLNNIKIKILLINYSKIYILLILKHLYFFIYVNILVLQKAIT